jgi:hypothetical protein
VIGVCLSPLLGVSDDPLEPESLRLRRMLFRPDAVTTVEVCFSTSAGLCCGRGLLFRISGLMIRVPDRVLLVVTASVEFGAGISMVSASVMRGALSFSSALLSFL